MKRLPAHVPIFPGAHTPVPVASIGSLVPSMPTTADHPLLATTLSDWPFCAIEIRHFGQEPAFDSICCQAPSIRSSCASARKIEAPRYRAVSFAERTTERRSQRRCCGVMRGTQPPPLFFRSRLLSCRSGMRGSAPTALAWARGSHSLDPAWPYSSARLKDREV